MKNNKIFKGWAKKPSKIQHFDKDKITLTKAGKTFNVYQSIQEAREDTEILPTLQKYGCIDRMITNHTQIIGDLTELSNLRSLHEMTKKSNEIWQSLPLEVRKEFNNNKNEFIDKGMDWAKRKVAEKKAKEENKDVQKEVNNG